MAPPPRAGSVDPVPPSARWLEAPVQPSRRIVTIDILRGFAIFGILLVHMEFFNQAMINMAVKSNPPVTALDQLARWCIAFFAEAKFYSIFSFLFGLGMAIQFGWAGTEGYRGLPPRHARFGHFWLRRMLVLLVFGLIHAYLFWPGDILTLYAVLGSALLLWRNSRPRTLLIWVVVFLLLPLLLDMALLVAVELGEQVAGEDAMAQMLDEQVTRMVAEARAADRVYATGSFLDVTQQRARDMNLNYSYWPFMAPSVLAMMLLGLYAGKRGVSSDIPGHLPLLRKVWVWGLIIGLAGNCLYVYFGEYSSRAVPSAANVLALAGQTLGAPALALFYMTSLTMLAVIAAWRARLAPLGDVGRMSLTNYLLQSVICTTLFYGYGFGWYGQIGIAAGIALTLAIYLGQVWVSRCWLRRYRFGPMEWVWRTLTYGRR